MNVSSYFIVHDSLGPGDIGTHTTLDETLLCCSIIMIHTRSERCVVPKTVSVVISAMEDVKRGKHSRQRGQNTSREQNDVGFYGQTCLSDTTCVAYMTTHAHKRPMHMRNMPEVSAPEYVCFRTQTRNPSKSLRFQISYAFSGSGGTLGLDTSLIMQSE